MHEPDQIVHDLQSILDDEGQDLARLIERSLTQARERAHAELAQPLLDALDWPRDLPEYYDDLRGFIRWLPQQSNARAWKTSAPEERYNCSCASILFAETQA